jgi:nucleotide-binding universal stress UspA family protein
MGSKGKNDLDEIIVGSTTEKITRTSKIPVLVVKNENEEFRIKELVFASDFEEDSKKSFELFLDFAKKFESKIHLLKINTAQKFENTNTVKETIETFLKDFEVPKYTICVYNDSTIEKGISNFSKDIDADIIAITTHGRNRLSRFFNGSISKKLTQKALRPVLTFMI